MENPRREIFNNLADTWDEHLNLTDEKISSISYVLDKCNCQPADKILDVGCGTGVLVPFLIERIGESGSIVGIDLAEKMIEVARSKFDDSRVSFVADDIFTHPFEPASFDKIFVFSAFPHFEDKAKTVAVFHKLLKPGGCLSISHVESSEVINNFHGNLQTAVLRGDQLPSAQEMTKLIDKAGWEVLEAKDQHKLYHLLLRKI